MTVLQAIFFTTVLIGYSSLCVVLLGGPLLRAFQRSLRERMGPPIRSGRRTARIGQTLLESTRAHRLHSWKIGKARWQVIQQDGKAQFEKDAFISKLAPQKGTSA